MSEDININFSNMDDVLNTYNDPEVILVKGEIDKRFQQGAVFALGRSAFQITQTRTRGRASIKFIGNVHIREREKK